jgi:hypothetical protein
MRGQGPFVTRPLSCKRTVAPRKDWESSVRTGMHRAHQMARSVRCSRTFVFSSFSFPCVAAFRVCAAALRCRLSA